MTESLSWLTGFTALSWILGTADWAGFAAVPVAVLISLVTLGVAGRQALSQIFGISARLSVEKDEKEAKSAGDLA